MTTYVYRNGELVEKSQAAPLEYKHDDAFYVTSDTMEPTRHMADGNYYDSKAKFRQVTRAHGCIEIGTEEKTLLTPRKPITLDRAQRIESIKQAIYELKNKRR